MEVLRDERRNYVGMIMVIAFLTEFMPQKSILRNEICTSSMKGQHIAMNNTKIVGFPLSASIFCANL
jgi:hypothetical protein